MQDDVAGQVEDQIEFLHRCRSVFPHLSPELVGRDSFDTAPYYQTRGLGVSFKFSSPMTSDFIQRFNALGHWINQNFVLRLYAVLESNKLISDRVSIIQSVDGNEEMDILRRLRNCFAHGSGRYDHSDPENRKLRERLVSHFGLDLKDQGREQTRFQSQSTQFSFRSRKDASDMRRRWRRRSNTRLERTAEKRGRSTASR